MHAKSVHHACSGVAPGLSGCSAERARTSRAAASRGSTTSTAMPAPSSKAARAVVRGATSTCQWNGPGGPNGAVCSHQLSGAPPVTSSTAARTRLSVAASAARVCRAGARGSRRRGGPAQARPRRGSGTRRESRRRCRHRRAAASRRRARARRCRTAGSAPRFRVVAGEVRRPRRPAPAARPAGRRAARADGRATHRRPAPWLTATQSRRGTGGCVRPQPPLCRGERRRSTSSSLNSCSGASCVGEWIDDLVAAGEDRGTCWAPRAASTRGRRRRRPRAAGRRPRAA